MNSESLVEVDIVLLFKPVVIRLDDEEVLVETEDLCLEKVVFIEVDKTLLIVFLLCRVEGKVIRLLEEIKVVVTKREEMRLLDVELNRRDADAEGSRGPDVTSSGSA